MQISVVTLLGAILALLAITFAGVLAGKKVRGAKDFATGSNMGTLLTAGSLVGTLVGGAATIGTAQLAFTYGFSAWWFTLGGGLGLFVLAAVFSDPLRASGVRTLPQILKKHYGSGIATTAAVLMSIGTFISILSQMLSGAALVTSMGELPTWGAMVLVALLMGSYVLFGGARGAGIVGMVKTVLLYGATLACGIVAVSKAGGFASFGALPQQQYFNLFARGLWTDGGAGASLIFGVLTTQAYILPILSAKDGKTGKRGAVLGGVLAICIGICGIFVGLFMRLYAPNTPTASVLPRFILMCLPEFLGGLVLGTLLVTLVGTGAGLALGISSMVTYDIYLPHIRPKAKDTEQLWVCRGIIALILGLSAVLACGEMGSLILSWSFLSMGLRGAVAFVPVCFCLFCPGKLPKAFAAASMAAGPLLVLVGKYGFPSAVDPLFYGMAGSCVLCCAGILWERYVNQKTESR